MDSPILCKLSPEVTTPPRVHKPLPCPFILRIFSTPVLITTRNFSDGHGEIYWKEGRIVK
ncbi:hypothetical protein [Larkinella bovis]|uniref:hypothetical protein n=1 Tax=Larkinella bovis TaxID=683041 RepID=UPI0036D43BC5